MPPSAREAKAALPFTGIATFARAPHVPPEALQPGQADFAVIGVPFDAAVGFRPGQRLAPRAIRDLSTRYALPWGPDNPGYWDVQDHCWYLEGCRLVDLGDADPLYTDLDHLDHSVAHVVGAALRAGAVPVVLGGDHSITYPVLRAYGAVLGGPAGPGAAAGPAGAGAGAVAGRTGPGPLPSSAAGGVRLHILQIDAHLDFTDRVAGFLRSNSSPFRRAAELPFIGTITVIGVRGIRTSPEAFAAAVERGNRIVTMREWRAAWAMRAAAASGAGAGAMPGTPPASGEERDPLERFLEAIPRGEPLYISLDIDGLDPAIAPGTSSPEPGGLTYEEVREILRLAAARAQVVAVDIVEVNPYLDPGGMTALLAARLAIEAMAVTFRPDGKTA